MQFIAEEYEAIAPSDDISDLSNFERCDHFCIVDIGCRFQFFNAEFIVLIVVTAEVGLFNNIVTKAINCADVGCDLEGGKHRWVIDIVDINERKVCIREIQDRADIAFTLWQFEDDRALYRTFWVDHCCNIFEYLLVLFIFGIVVFAEVPLYDSNSTFVFVVVPRAIAAFDRVIDGNGQQINFTIAVHTDHFVCLIEVPVHCRAGPTSAFYIDTFSLDQSDFTEASYIDNADCESSRKASSLTICSAFKTGAMSCVISTNSQ